MSFFGLSTFGTLRMGVATTLRVAVALLVAPCVVFAVVSYVEAHPRPASTRDAPTTARPPLNGLSIAFALHTDVSAAYCRRFSCLGRLSGRPESSLSSASAAGPPTVG